MVSLKKLSEFYFCFPDCVIMPPKKKRKTTAKPGKAALFLSSAYEICNKVSPVCNGHIVYLYTNNSTKSVVEVSAKIKELLNIDIQTFYDVQRVVNQMNKLKPLSVETIFVKFKEFCSQEFSVIERGPLSETSSALHEAASNEVTIPVVSPLLEQSPQTRSVSGCQNCARYRDVLEKERGAKKALRNKIRNAERKKTKRASAQRVLGQKVRRQRQRIKELKEANANLKKIPKQDKELQILKRSVAELKQTVAHLKRNNKRNKLNYLKSRMLSAAKATDTVQDASLKVKSKLEQQSIEINALEDQLLCTKEKLNEATEGRKQSLKGKK